MSALMMMVSLKIYLYLSNVSFDDDGIPKIPSKVLIPYNLAPDMKYLMENKPLLQEHYIFAWNAIPSNDGTIFERYLGSINYDHG